MIARNAFIVSGGEDVGGVGVAIVRAVERFGSGRWKVRAMRGGDNYIRYPADVTWDLGRFLELYAGADVVHGMERLDNVLEAAGIRQLDRPAVLHHHGSAFRDGPAIAEWAARWGVIQLASTLDLTLIHPAVRWVGNPADVDWFRGFRRQYAPGPWDEFTIGHTPTFRAVKGTAVLLEAAAAARIRVLLAEGVPWVGSLMTKASAGAYFDQLAYGFGLSACEAWAMGLPVVAGVADPAVLELMRATWDELPFVLVDPTAESVFDAITRLRDDSRFRRAAAARGARYVRRFHDARIVARQLEAIWDEAAG